MVHLTIDEQSEDVLDCSLSYAPAPATPLRQHIYSKQLVCELHYLWMEQKGCTGPVEPFLFVYRPPAPEGHVSCLHFNIVFIVLIAFVAIVLVGFIRNIFSHLHK